jgi:hypothetical protein
MTNREYRNRNALFIALFVGMDAAGSLVAHAQKSDMLGATNATTATPSQIKVAPSRRCLPIFD